MFETIGQINRGSLLGEHIFNLAKNPEIKSIVEIGTWNGLGTTKCIYDGIIQGNKRDYNVWSLEINLMRHKEAKTNLLPLNNFNIIHGTIVSEEEHLKLKEKFGNHPWLVEDIQHVKTSEYVFDKLPKNIDLLILDGGEFTSYIEFEKLWKRSHFIVLDDTNKDLSYKNWEVREFILSSPHDFKIIEDNLKDRNGFLVCEKIN